MLKLSSSTKSTPSSSISPTTLPSESSSFTSTSGSGRPIEPTFGAFSPSVLVSTGAVSVSPYPSYTGRPTASANRRAVATSSGAAPDTATRTVLNASTSRSPISDQATYIGGTPTTTVTLCRRIRASVSAGSKRSTSTPHAPWYAIAPRPVFSPYEWNSGSVSSTTSAPVSGGGSMSASWAWLAISARCDSIAPFGMPEVPDV